VYYFKPMMPLYLKIIHAPTEWLMSAEGRRLIAKTLRLCRNRHGKQQARDFYNALTVNGAIYPILRKVLDNYDTCLNTEAKLSDLHTTWGTK
jgi:hypothetical protein